MGPNRRSYRGADLALNRTSTRLHPICEPDKISDIGVPEVPEFLEQIVASGGHLWACRMSADMMHLDEDDLYEEVEGIISAADFIEKTEGAQLLFI